MLSAVRLFVFLAFAPVFLGISLWPQSQPCQEFPRERRFEVQDLPAPPSDERSRSIRQRRGAAFNTLSGARKLTARPMRPRHGPQPPEFPPRLTLVEPGPAGPPSDLLHYAVIVGRVLSIQTCLSEDETDIYREIAVDVEDVLENSPYSPVPGSGTVTLALVGGALRLPDGRVVRHVIQGADIRQALRSGGRYVLYLIYRADAFAFNLHYAWRLENGRVFPMSCSQVRLLESMRREEAGFIADLRQSLRAAAHPNSM